MAWRQALRGRFLAVGVVLFASASVNSRADEIPPNSIFVRSYEYDRGNVLVYDVGISYADTEPVVINGGKLPNTMEFDLEIPVGGTYTFQGRYAAADSRPVDIYVDDQVVHRGFASVTGSWQASTAIWERQCELSLDPGPHTIKLICPGPCIPHIIAFRLDSETPFPPGWRRKPKPIETNLHMTWSGAPEEGAVGFGAYIREDGFVDAPEDYNPIIPYKRIPAPIPNAERVLEYLLMGAGAPEVAVEIEHEGWEGAWVAHLSAQLSSERTDSAVLMLSPERIERMLRHVELLARSLGEGGDSSRLEAEGLLEKLRETEDRPGDGEAVGRELYDLYVQGYLLKNRVALANPLLDFEQLLFVKRPTYDTSHIYTTYFDGSHRFGGGLHLLNGLRPDADTRKLVSELGDQAIFRDPDLSWDGKRVLFAYKPDAPTPNRVYEVGIDGSGLRQLTDSGYDDVDPCYLPDGRIMFVSSRCRRVVLCHNAFTVSVLYTMDADGGDVRCVSANTVNDFTPSVMNDGRVVYTRWEYVDKHLGNNQSMWIVDPDGSSPTHMAGEHWGPITFWEPRQIPGSSLVVTTLSPHMPIAVGPIALVDPADTCSSPAIYENITPELPAPHHFGWHRSDVGYYCNPYPLSEDFFIVSYAYGPDPEQPEGYGLYLLDRWGNRDLIYRDPTTSCFEAIPVRARPKDPVMPPAGEPDGPEEPSNGRYVVLNVYDGLDGVEPGSVKHLRVMQEIPKPVSAQCSGYGLQYPVISNYGHLAVKKLLGTVPVEEDGSVSFEAPPNVALYFAALDEDFAEIQRMRALTELRPGETITCVGCHEHRTTAPPNRMPTALAREPSTIIPPPGGAHAPDFAYDVQPVLNLKHCRSCHTGDKPAGGVDLSPDPTNLFNVAFESLTGGGYVNYVDARKAGNLPLRPAMSFGSHAGRLMELMRTTHAERVELSAEDHRRLVTWIDSNAPYYGTYRFTRPGTVGGRELLTPAIRGKLTEVHQQSCTSCHGDTLMVERIDFAEPLKSPALLAPLSVAAGGTEACGEAVFADREAAGAVALVGALTQLGQEIIDNPRMDMLSERPRILADDFRYVYRPGVE